MCVTVWVLRYKNKKNGDRGTIVFTATLSLPASGDVLVHLLLETTCPVLNYLIPKDSSNAYGGSYGNKILYKNLDLTQDFPNKISFHFLWVKILHKNVPKIFR